MIIAGSLVLLILDIVATETDERGTKNGQPGRYLRYSDIVLKNQRSTVLKTVAAEGRGNYEGTTGTGALLSRDRRTLTFLPPSTLLLIFGLGTPLQLDRESVIVGSFAKIIYALPDNSTDFTEPGVHFARTKSRWSIYKLLENAAELYGFGGKGCLLRAICEVAAAPFDLRHGIFGQMAQALLSTREPYDEYTDREYHAAESLGKHVGENCHALYPECERSVLDVFSTTAATFERPTTPAAPTTTTTQR